MVSRLALWDSASGGGDVLRLSLMSVVEPTIWGGEVASVRWATDWRRDWSFRSAGAVYYEGRISGDRGML